MIYHDTLKYSVLLSVLDDSAFQSEDDHNHDLTITSNCIDLLPVLSEVKELADTMPNVNENKEENVQDIAQTTIAIFNWMKHIF